jgi:centrosomal CEP192-like protein/HYDIN/CFA65/VesB family protein
VAGSSSSQTITISNSGTAQATISQANVSGAAFRVSGLTMPAYIAAGQSVSFSIIFSPANVGNASGSIAVVSDAPNSPLMIAASGSAIAASGPALTSNANALNFGSVVVGSNNMLGATLTNTGTANVTITGMAVTGAGFSASGISANMTLTPGQSAPINVAFTPQAAGSVAGAVTVSSNAPTLTISLLGNGGTASSHAVALTWDPSTSDVIGYNVYRAPSDGTGAYEKINTVVQVETQFTDQNIVAGQEYMYVVTAVDSDDVESEYSDPAVADVP